MSKTDRKEAESQVRCLMIDPTEEAAATARSGDSHRSRERLHRRTSLSTVTNIFLDEEIYLAQLALRARILNKDFQRAVLDVVSSHQVSRDFSITQENASGRCQPLHHEGKIHVMQCTFDQGPAWVEVHSAPPKRITRMREKVFEYAPPHPQATWPLCANILDPVRLSIVIRGSCQIVQTMRWFTDHEADTGLRICRVKNGFASNGDSDGYRDLKLCVLFSSRDGLSIIGEIQIHDSVLFDLKENKVACPLFLVAKSCFFSLSCPFLLVN